MTEMEIDKKDEKLTVVRLFFERAKKLKTKNYVSDCLKLNEIKYFNPVKNSVV